MRSCLTILSLFSVMLFTAFPGCNRSEFKSYVNIPTDLKKIRELEKKSDTTVKIERQTKVAGGGACGHSPVCLIVVPIILFNALFPEKYDLVTITENGRVTYSAMFSTDGEFIQARTTDGKTVRDYRRMDLAKLKRKIVVEIASGTEGSAENAMIPSPVLSQTHLDEDYRRAIMDASSEKEKAEFLTEATDGFGTESVPLLRESFQSHDFGSEAVGFTISHICEKESTGTLRDNALAYLTEAHGAPAYLATIDCFNSDDPKAKPFIQKLVRIVCESGDKTLSVPAGVVSWDGHISTSVREHKARIASDAEPEIESCKLPAGKTLWRVALDLPVSSSDIQASFSDESFKREVVAQLDLDRTEERKALFALIGRKDDEAPAIERLSKGRWVAEGDELAIVASQYFPEYHSILTSSDFSRRGTILRIFHDQKDPVARERALSAVHQTIAGAKPEFLPMIRIAQVVLGKHDYALAAARGLTPHASQHITGIRDAGDLIYFGLSLAGCEDARIREAYYSSREAKDTDRSVLCTQP